VVAIALETVPRITGAHKLDALSTVAPLAGYRSVQLTGYALPRISPSDPPPRPAESPPPERNVTTYYSRHGRDLDVSLETRRQLWDDRWVAIHFPEHADGTIGPKDSESVDPADYPPNAAVNVRALRDLAEHGGYVVSDHLGHDEYLLGYVAPNTPVELLHGEWGEYGSHPSRPAVMKGVRIPDAQLFTARDIGPILQRRPARATLRRWPSAGTEIEALVEGGPIPHDPDANHWHRAYLAWDELGDFAASSRTVSYGALGKLIGVHHRVVRFALEHIQDYCLENALPPLTILVVGKSNRKPGQGFIAWEGDLVEGVEQVFAWDWKAYGNPFSFAAGGATREEVARRLLADPTSAEDVYGTLKVRGAAQMLFRDALLEAYDRRCALTGSALESGLEAAHIVPWSAATAAERLDVRNGILLTTWHHRLWDAGILNIGADYQVSVDPDVLSTAAGFDASALVALEGARLRLPDNPLHRPALELLRRRGEAGS